MAALLAASSVGLDALAESTAFEATLANGMKVVVKEDHRSPVVVSQVWYRAGSIDEFNGTTGVAHALEHLMFKGTPTVPVGQFSKIIAANGGRDNAFTSRDYTSFFQQLQKDKLELALRMEADRMQHLLFSADEFSKEIQVVMEERRLRTEDNPQALVYEQLMATAFTAHPYRRPTIGWMSDLQNMTAGDAQAWYERWYVPNNAVLVVVGDVEPKAVLALAEKYFGGYAVKPLPVRKPQAEPEQRGARRVAVKAPAQFPYLAMAWHAPVLRDVDRDWEPYALQVLAGVLDGSNSARLPKALVREQRIASNIDVGFDSVERGPGMFLVDGTPSEGKTATDLETAIREQLDLIKKDGVRSDELQRVKAQVIAGQVFQLDSMFAQAMQIGMLEMVGLGHAAQQKMLDKLKAVTADQVQAVAQKYLVNDNLTVAVLDPQPLESKPAAPPAKGQRHGG